MEKHSQNMIDSVERVNLKSFKTLRPSSKNYFGMGYSIKLMQKNQKKFTQSLFSDKLSDKLKASTNIDTDLINKSLKLLRYEYVKNTLFNTKSIRQIVWEPKTIDRSQNITNTQTDNIYRNSDTKEKIDKATPQLSNFIGSIYIGVLSDELKPVITFLSNELLPFLPNEYRFWCFMLIMFMVAFNKLDKN